VFGLFAAVVCIIVLYLVAPGFMWTKEDALAAAEVSVIRVIALGLLVGLLVFLGSLVGKAVGWTRDWRQGHNMIWIH